MNASQEPYVLYFYVVFVPTAAQTTLTTTTTTQSQFQETTPTISPSRKPVTKRTSTQTETVSYIFPEALAFDFSKLRSGPRKPRYCASAKCHFAFPKVKYLGHIVSREGIQPDLDKICAVKDFPVSTKVTDVRSFLGLRNYYRRFVKDFSKLAKLFTQLPHKNVK